MSGEPKPVVAEKAVPNERADRAKLLARITPTKVMGAAGTVVYGGYLGEIEKHSDLSGSTKYTTYGDMVVNASIVAAAVRYFLNLASSVTWDVVEADKSDESKEASEFVGKMIEGMDTPIPKVVRRTAMFKFYGFSIQEWIAKQGYDGKYRIDQVRPRPQKTINRWDFTSKEGVSGVWQIDPQTLSEIYLPIEKLVYTVDDSLSDSPEGLGLFRHVVDRWRTLERFYILELGGYEADLRGIPIARAPLATLDNYTDPETGAKLTEAQKVAILKPLTDFMDQHIRSTKLGLLLDSMTYTAQDEAGSVSAVKQWDVELLQVNSTSLEPIRRAINDIIHEIAVLMGVENLLLGGGERGSHALARDKSHNLYMTINATLSDLAYSYRKNLLKPTWALNGWDWRTVPTLKPQPVQFKDVEQITRSLREMAAAGLVIRPGDPVANAVRDLLGLPRMPDGVDSMDASLMSGRNEEGA